jgi:O-methyltransferase
MQESKIKLKTENKSLRNCNLLDMLIQKNQLGDTISSIGYSLLTSIRETQLSIKFSNIYEKYSPYTMIPKPTFVENLKLCKRFRHVKGCIIECGVWRGGMSAAMAEVLGNNRNYYLFDSFEGLPEAKEIDGEAAIKWQNDKESPLYYENCKAETDYADKAMKISGAKNYNLIKGWFSETLPEFDPKEEISILRLDGDWYDSTIDCLKFLYPKVAKGGLIIVDDYYAWDGCSRAVHDYLSAQKLSDRIFQINGNSYIIKT